MFVCMYVCYNIHIKNGDFMLLSWTWTWTLNLHIHMKYNSIDFIFAYYINTVWQVINKIVIIAAGCYSNTYIYIMGYITHFRFSLRFVNGLFVFVFILILDLLYYFCCIYLQFYIFMATKCYRILFEFRFLNSCCISIYFFIKFQKPN